MEDRLVFEDRLLGRKLVALGSMYALDKWGRLHIVENVFIFNLDD